MDYTKSDFISFDSYRGLLAIVVVLGHLFLIFWYPIIGFDHFIAHIARTLSNYSVIGFFVISGAMIAKSINNNINKNGTFNWYNYLISRIARIYPSLIISILLGVFFYLLIGNAALRLPEDLYATRQSFFLNPRDVFSALYMKPSSLITINGSLWSLYVEWWLYIWAMLLVIIYKSKKMTSILSTILLIFLLFKLVKNEYLIYYFSWILGTFITIINKRNFFKYGSALFSSLIACYILVIYGIRGFSIASNPLHLSQIFFIGTFVYLTLTTMRKPNIFSKAASFSYTIYIIHFPILLFSFAIIHPIIKNNILLVSAFSFIIFSFIIWLSFRIAIVTENKKLYVEKFYYVKNTCYQLYKNKKNS